MYKIWFGLRSRNVERGQYQYQSNKEDEQVKQDFFFHNYRVAQNKSDYNRTDEQIRKTTTT